MIEINLQPEENKVKLKKEKADSKFKQLLLIIPAAVGLLLLVHILLTVALIFKGFKLRTLTNEIKTLEPQKKALEQANKEQALLSRDAILTQQLLTGRSSFAQKLNSLSLDLPGGVWFEEVSFEDKKIIIKGSVISLQKEEMGLINRFINALKADDAFTKNLDTLDLSSAKKRTVAGYDIVDFILIGKLKGA